VLRLLLEPDHRAVGRQLGHPEPLRVGNLVEERPAPHGRSRTRGPRPRAPGRGGCCRPGRSRTRRRRRSRGPARSRGRCERAALVAVGEAEPEMLAVAQELHHVADACRRRSPSPRGCPSRPASRAVVDHRAVVDRQEVLVGHDREREEARRRAAARITPSWPRLVDGDEAGRFVGRGVGASVANGCSSRAASRRGSLVGSAGRSRRGSALVVRDHEHHLQAIQVDAGSRYAVWINRVRIAGDVVHAGR